MTRTRTDILDDLAREEARLVDLEKARELTRQRLASLRSELDAASTPVPAPRPSPRPSDSTPRTSEEKVRLFRSLFRGRPDVFPARFVSKKTTKAGYSPECANKWQPNVCILNTGGKCGQCPNQAFTPISDRVILDHLQGRHVIGIYPLLQDETCWLLAADFDKNSWQEDVVAFSETCWSLDVPVAIERSRSGNGAHAWFFFTAPVTANVARRMGSYLITETMARRHELALSSYDRLFPNQDTMPRGGFGNLIALPLQHEPRKHGNSVFIDEHVRPFPDQWAFLASVPRIEPDMAEAIAREASRTGRVIGVRPAGWMDADWTDEKETDAPWSRPPSGQSTRQPITAPLPASVRAVLAQRLFIEKTGLPSRLLNELKRLAAFQNPDFYKKQRMRLSTAGEPRVIACVEDLPRFLALPRGCTPQVQQLLADHCVDLTMQDEREAGSPIELSFQGELTAAQQAAASALLAHDTGVFVAPPGIGKTVLGTYLVAQRGRNTLILVHRQPLLDQWIAQLAIFLGIGEKEIGRIGGGRQKPNGLLDVATFQSLARKGTVKDLVASYGHVIVDECHHVPASSFDAVLSEVKARFVVGLTATRQRCDGRHPIIDMQIGPVRYKVDARSQTARSPFEHKLIVRETAFRLALAQTDTPIQDIYRALAGDEARNARIIDDVLAALEEGRSPILITERKDHLDYFEHRLRGAVRHLIVLKGGMNAKARRGSAEQLASISDSAERLVLATGRYIGEGFDDARLDTLFLAMPVSWKGTLIQYSGRLHRHHPAKADVRVYDYVDAEVPLLLRMFEKRRLPAYRAIGYARGEAPLGFAEAAEERVVEYDEEALRHLDAEW